MFHFKNLPILNKKKEICQSICNNQVVIVSGETGSGKTTQIPKICLEIGRGVNKLIGHTQPRRIAAKSIAERIAKELNSNLGDKVGYKVRFCEKVSDNTSIKLMTDGILLAELYNDKLLMKYDTIIIDEAHERTLNIDFILAYLRSILSIRTDLKLIISSATINSELFSKYFNNAPIIEIEGKVYPIEIRYRPFIYFKKNFFKVQIQSIIQAIKELICEPKGDIIIFLSNELEIRKSAKEIKKLNLVNTEVLVIYSNLTESEQNKIFDFYIGRRIILSTNIAETSLTIPGIKYVIDSGYARISRYNYRNKIQYLPIELISQASANQRSGRCGRISPGICIRLYSKENFLSRPKDSDPEILRINISSVMLQMIAIELGDISKFSFIQNPNKKNIKYSIKLLKELNAIEDKKNNNMYKLTNIGRQLVRLPIDPNFGRMIIEAKKYNCVREVMIISSALSIPDPRESILEKKEIIKKKHRFFTDSKSDFMSFLKLWEFIKNKKKNLSKSEFLNECKDNFLNFIRLEEWFDIYNQLKKIIKEMGIVINYQPASYESIHISLLSGLFLNIGKNKKKKNIFFGVHKNVFSVFPNSTLFNKFSNLIVVAKLIKTNKLWGLVAAKIHPKWVELVAKHLVKNYYDNKFWSKNKGCVIANKKTKLFNLTLVNYFQVDYSSVDPVFCRKKFIYCALIKGEWKENFDFYFKNIILIKKIKKIEDKLRRKDLLVSKKILYSFYEKKIDSSVCSVKKFKNWWTKKKKLQPNLLNFDKDFLMNKKIDLIILNQYPDYWIQKKFKFKLNYKFDFGSKRDGVTVDIPFFLLYQVECIGFDWNVPGFRKELIEYLIKFLPKKIRFLVHPIKNFLKIFLKEIVFSNEKLLFVLAKKLKDMIGVIVRPKDWKWNLLPDYLKMNFRVLDEKNEIIDENRSLSILKKNLNEKIRKKIVHVFSNFEENNLKKWNFKNFVKTCQKKYGQYIIYAYPAIVDNKNSVSIKLVLSRREQLLHTKIGLRRLLLIALFKKRILEKLICNSEFFLFFEFFKKKMKILNDCFICGVDELISHFEKLVWSLEDYKRLEFYVFNNINKIFFKIVEKIKLIFSNYHLINNFLNKNIMHFSKIILSDIKSQLDFLMFEDFVVIHGYKKLSDIVRYTYGIKLRLEKIIIDSKQDLFYMNKIINIKKKLDVFLVELNVLNFDSVIFKDINWMIEELRINFFAQKLGNTFLISEKIILKEIKKIENLYYKYI